MSSVNVLDNVLDRVDVLYYMLGKGMLLKEDLLKIVNEELDNIDDNSRDEVDSYMTIVQQLHEKEIINDDNFMVRIGFSEYKNGLLK